MDSKRGLSNIIAVSILVSLSLIAVLILWIVVSSIINSYSDDITLNKIDNNIESPNGCGDNCSDENGCDEFWQCGDWGDCNVEYNLNDLILRNNDFKGTQFRVCNDLNFCVDKDRVEEQTCELPIQIYVKKIYWCGEDYVDVYLKHSDDLIGRVKMSEIEDFKDLLKLDISFYSNNSIPYCLYCYDNQMNYDEVGIDCGGSCLECIEKFEFIDWLYYVIIILWIVLILLFFAYTLLEDKVKKKIKSFIRKS